MEITGLGDPMPAGLEHMEQHFQAAREISASQLYGKWEPKVPAKYLASLLKALPTSPRKQLNLEPFRRHNHTDGFGPPVSFEDLKEWEGVT